MLDELVQLNAATFADTNATVLPGQQYLGQTGTLTAARTVALPAASAVAQNHRVTIIDQSGTCSLLKTITIAAAGSDTIRYNEQSGATFVLRSPGEVVTLRSDGVSSWQVVSATVGALQTWTPKLVVNDATVAADGTITGPSAGTLPVLGTGGSTYGEVTKLGPDADFATATATWGPNASTVNATDATSTVSANKFTKAGYSNGMAVILSSLGGTVISLPSLNADGSYYVVGTSGNDWNISQTSGGSVVPLSGSNATGVHVTAIAASAGSGAYRFSNPEPVPSLARTNRRILGVAQLFNDVVAHQGFGVNAGEYLTATLHTAESLLDGSTTGIVLASTLPLTSFQGGYTVSNHTDLRTIDETAVSNPPTQAEVIALKHVVGTILNDMVALLAQNGSINVGHNVPWAWGPNYRIQAFWVEHHA